MPHVFTWPMLTLRCTFLRQVIYENDYNFFAMHSSAPGFCHQLRLNIPLTSKAAVPGHQLSPSKFASDPPFLRWNFNPSFSIMMAASLDCDGNTRQRVHDSLHTNKAFEDFVGPFNQIRSTCLGACEPTRHRYCYTFSAHTSRPLKPTLACLTRIWLWSTIQDRGRHGTILKGRAYVLISTRKPRLKMVSLLTHSLHCNWVADFTS